MIALVRRSNLLPLALLVVSAAACKKDPPPSSSSCSPSEAKNGLAQVCADEKGFTPTRLEIKKGEKLQVIFTRTTNETCATEIVSQELGINKQLPLNTPVAVDIPTGDAKSITFACGMKMFTSTVIIKPM